MNRSFVAGVFAAQVFLGSAVAVAAGDGPAFVRTSLVLKVAQRDKATTAIVEKAESLGGYFSTLTGDEVVLRVPVEQVATLTEFADSVGLVADRSYHSQDLRETLDDKRTQLKARQDVLDQYFALLPRASRKSVLTVEREITRLVAEVEGLEGSIRLMEHQARFAQVDVAFRFRERNAPSRDGTSSFDWLNTLNLADLVDDFYADEPRRTGKRNRVDASTPDGFSAYDDRRQHRAVSPDGVMFRIRSTQPDSEADLAFWKEAMAKRMRDAGYHSLREADIEAGDTAGVLIEWTAPFGTADYAYAVAVFPVDKRLVIVESGGPVPRYEARRDAVVAAIQALGL